MTAFTFPVDAESARQFLRELHARGLLYHPEDPAADCLGHHALSAEELAGIEARMRATFDHLEDPCEDALALLNSED